MIYEFSDIDFPPSHNPVTRGAEADYFSLFEFSAKYDPVPTMLTQNQVQVVKGFMGQTTGFYKNMIKSHVIIMGEDPAQTRLSISTVTMERNIHFMVVMTLKIISIL